MAVGKTLYVGPKYFRQAHRCVLVLGVMLGHVLWRKLFPEQRKAADKHINNLSYDLLVERHYSVAARLLDFACALKKFESEELRRLMVVNRAQAYKWLGDDGKCAEIMSREDWSASDDSFRLADAVLRDNVDESTRIMKRLGVDHDFITKQTYRDWPLFRKIRPNETFRMTYEEIFGEPLERIEVKLDKKSKDDWKDIQQGVRRPIHGHETIATGSAGSRPWPMPALSGCSGLRGGRRVVTGLGKVDGEREANLLRRGGP